MKIYEKLRTIQQKLNAPKTRQNTYGNYSYRSCEDIFEAVKPLLEETGCILTVTDELVQIGERYYVKATATLINIAEKDESYGAPDRIYNVAYAREPEDKKGTDASQITGACSSSARKYALNGLFLIDDVKDADATNTHGKEPEPKQEPKAASKTAPKVDAKKTVREEIEEDLNRRVTKEEVQKIIAGCKENDVDVSKICKLYKKESLADLSAFQYKHIFNNWKRIKDAK